jgi:acetyl/propionyl-CoA carboxylase alpha subunit
MADVTPGGTPGELIVRDGNRVERMYAVADGDTVWVFHDGAVHQVTTEMPTRRATGHHHALLMSPMPATVIAVNVAPGDTVTRGQILVLLEAMKMELPVRAPGDGTVAKVHCAPGDLVQPNVSLIDLDPREPQGHAERRRGVE